MTNPVAKLLSEAAPINKATAARNFRRGEARFLEQFHRGDDPRLNQKLLRVETKGVLEAALKVAHGKTTRLRNLTEHNWTGEIATNDFNGARHALDDRQPRFMLGRTPDHTSRPTNATVRILKWKLANKEPVGRSLLVEPKFHALDAASLTRQQARVVTHVTGGHVVWGDIKIGQAENLSFMAQLVVLKEAATYQHEAPLSVFAVEADTGQMIKEHVKMSIGMHLAQPRSPLTCETLIMRLRRPTACSSRRIWHNLCRHALINWRVV